MCAEKTFEGREEVELKKVEEILELAQKKRKENKEIPIDQSLEGLPRDIQKDVKELKDEFSRWSEDYGVPQDKTEEMVKREISRSQASYIDKRFEMPNKAFAKYEVRKQIDGLLEQEPKPKGLNKIAKLSFDLNGLKSVNDLNAGKHEYGDEYLRRVAGALKDEESDISKELREKNIQVSVSVEGGDEFGVLLVGEKELTQDELAQIIAQYNKMITSLEVGDLVDFNKEEVLRTYAGIGEPEWLAMDKAERKRTMAGIKERVPSDFKFTASASGGGSTLLNALEKGNVNISEQDDYPRILEKLMGSLFDVSDQEMNDAKRKFKNTLRESELPKERFLMDVYSRTEAQRELERKNQELSAQNRELAEQAQNLKDAMEKIKLLVEAGADQKTLQKNLDEIMSLRPE
ncbi:hypothetical protein KJ969_02660 [Patescibacteria group bacterium]|nr:hypothetical protein [Patescibacteria group bacterium]MBU1922361.1 hypothetical protein [Patescibacteria group bacterium]